MPAPRHVAVIDVGKTNVKLALVETGEWQEVEVHRMANRVIQDPPYPHFDIDAIWRFILSAMGRLHLSHGVDAISVTTHGATAALLTREGELALPVLDYEHDGPDDTAAEYAALRPGFAHTGSPSLPGGLNIGAQLHWMKSRFPEQFAATDAILMYPQYWAYRLSGVRANEVTSLGCHTDLWAPGLRDYSELVDNLGLRPKMAPIRTAFDRLGPVTTEVAQISGLAPDTPVFCGIHDSNASLLPYVLMPERPLGVVSTGTWVITMGLGTSGAQLDPERDMLVNVDAFGEPVPSARFMGGRWFTELLGDDPTPADAGDLARAAVSGVSVELGGSTSEPVWRGDAGQISPGTRHVIVSQFLASETARRLDWIGAGGPIRIEGPFARNQVYCQTLGELTGREVQGGAEAATGTSIGAAMLTGSQRVP